MIVLDNVIHEDVFDKCKENLLGSLKESTREIWFDLDTELKILASIRFDTSPRRQLFGPKVAKKKNILEPLWLYLASLAGFGPTFFCFGGLHNLNVVP